LNFVDTNVLIAASVTSHPHHPACSRRLAQLQNSDKSCAAHSLAETYSSLTRISKGYAIPAFDAAQIITTIQKKFSLITLTAREVVNTIEAASQRGLGGPLIYDALILACARKSNAKVIFTYDVTDFKRIAPDLASRIQLP
jgi:predicted nucleic acid-binding protein